jgi:hypothetical protein
MPPKKTKSSFSDDDQTLSVPSVEELPLSDGNEAEDDIGMNLMTSKLRYHSNESIYDDIKKSDKQYDQEEIVGAGSVSVTSKQRKTFQKRRVAKVKSTPAFLNQISEERESDLDDSPRSTPRVRRSSRRPLNVIQKTRRPSGTSSTGGRRSSSHSSSSEDDGDLDKKMRRLSTERCRRSPKRRSDDEGDGDDGDGGTRGPHGVARKKMMSEKPQQSGCNKETSSESGSSSNEQGKTAQLGLHSELLKDKLLNVYIKLNEDQNTSSAENENTVMETASCCQTDLSDNLLDLSHNREPLLCSENLSNHQNLEPHLPIGGEHLGNMETSVESVASSENIIECSKDIEGNSKNVAKPDECINSDTKSEDNVKSENMLVDSENLSMLSKDCTSNFKSRTNDFENIATTSQKKVTFLGKDLGDNSNENSEEVYTARKKNVWNEKYMVGDVSKDKGDTVLKCEASQSETNPVCQGAKKEENSENVMTRNDDVDDHIMEIFKERSLTIETLESISDKENVDITAEETKSYANGDTTRLRGSDIEEIEMYMKTKGTGLELDAVAVRTIFNNPKVSRVTSNCCQII